MCGVHMNMLISQLLSNLDLQIYIRLKAITDLCASDEDNQDGANSSIA